MDIQRTEGRPSVVGPAEWSTGAVRIDPLFGAPEPGRASGAGVTFEPDARSHWHRNPLGHTLIATSGLGRMRRWDGPVVTIRPGDVIPCPAGEKHWHGAGPTTATTHVAVQERKDGKVVEWLDPVTDEQYGRDA